MKERVIIGAFICAALLGTGTVRAHADGTAVVLTPTALYDKIEKLEEKHSKVLSVLLKHNRRLNELEAEVKKLKQGVDAKVEADVSETMQEALTGELRKH